MRSGMNVSSTVTPRKRRDNSTARIVEHAYFLGHTADLVFWRRGNEYFIRRRRPRRAGFGPNLGETPNAKERVTSKRRTDSPQRRARGASPDENGGVTSGESRPAVGPCRSNEGGSGVARQRKPAASDV